MATIANVQDLLTRLTTMDATAERRFPVTAEHVQAWTDEIRRAIAMGNALGEIRALAIDMKTQPFMGSGAGMKWLDLAWERLVEAFPVPVEEAELAAHLTNDLMEANR